MKDLKKLIPYLAVVFMLATCAVSVFSQDIFFNYRFKIDLADATEPPEFISNPGDIEYPESARKNGVTGTLKATCTLGPDGATSNIVISEGLPFGVSESVKAMLEKLKFKPAKKEGKPMPVRFFFEYVISAVFEETDKNISKPTIVEKPLPVYPESKRAEKQKGKVEVYVQFNSDGTLRILGVNSVLAKEFDKAAVEAAQKIKFQPAVHKKTKQPVSQKGTVTYDFKP